MPERRNSPSVLIVDGEPEILVLLSSMLESNDIRALRARSAAEALEIAGRRYVPIDLILCDEAINETITPDLLTALREIRPELRAIRMNARFDRGMIRIGLLPRGETAESGHPDGGLLSAIRMAMAAPRAGASGAN
jgi:CheY-like chemotaxis protein